jgi:flavin-dependent dehydrogenase
VSEVSFFWPFQKPIHARLPFISMQDPYAYGLSRKQLDHLILWEAKNRGCIVHKNQEAKRILRNGKTGHAFSVCVQNGSQSEIVYKGRLVINAAGKKHRWHSSPPLRQKRAFGFKAHFQNIPVGSVTELFFFEGGYLGIIEIENGLSNVCGKVEEKQLKDCQGRFDLLLQNASRQNPALSDRMKNAIRRTAWLSCGPLWEQFKKGYEDGVFYAGDAACFVEPFLGQGMAMAISSAFLLSSMLKQGPFSPDELERVGNIYEKGLKKLYASKLVLGKRLQLFAFSPFFGSFLAGLFNLFPFSLKNILKQSCSLPKGIYPDEGNFQALEATN